MSTAAPERAQRATDTPRRTRGADDVRRRRDIARAASRDATDAARQRTREGARRAAVASRRVTRRISRRVLIGAALAVIAMVGLVGVNTARIGVTSDTAAILEQERVMLSQLAEARLDKATLEAQVLRAAQEQLGMVPAASAGLIRIPGR